MTATQTARGTQGSKGAAGDQVSAPRGTLPKGTGRGPEAGLALPAREGGAPGGAGALRLPGEEGDRGRSQDVWRWVMESERQSSPSPTAPKALKRVTPWGLPEGPQGNGSAEPAPRTHPLTGTLQCLLRPQPILCGSWRRCPTPQGSGVAWPLSRGTGATWPLGRWEPCLSPTQRAKDTGRGPCPPG
jgi:hypothetical protein